MSISTRPLLIAVPLSLVCYVAAYALAGWAGVVVLAIGCAGALWWVMRD